MNSLDICRSTACENCCRICRLCYPGNMAEGWNRNQGKVDFRELTEEDVSECIDELTSTERNHTTSYKYAFLQALLDGLDEANPSNGFLSYEVLGLSFARQYWKQTIKEKQPQMVTHERASSSAAERIIRQFCADSHVGDQVDFDELPDEQKILLGRKFTVSVVKKDVLGAFWKDTHGQFYSFDKADDGIYLNPSCLEILMKNRAAYESANTGAWERFLIKVNSRIPAAIVTVLAAVYAVAAAMVTRLSA